MYFKVSGTTTTLKDEGEKEECDEDKRGGRDQTQSKEESLELLSVTN